MKIVLFYEKPGCTTNAQQKKMLRAAGCMVVERNLLEHGMNVEELFAFLEPMPVAQWFNPNAPKIKKGEIDPTTVSEQAALTLLLMDPILIKRPLMVIAGKKMCGFDQKEVEKCLGMPLNRSVPTACSSENETCNK